MGEQHRVRTRPRLLAESSGDGLLDRTFFISLMLKLADGVIELVGGVALLLISPALIQRAVVAVTRGEPAEDPADLVANWLVRYVDQLDVAATTFGAVYLLVHGLVKVLLVAAVLRNRLWAYPLLIAFLVVFIGWQCYAMVVHFTVGMLLLTLFDVFIVVLTLREYSRRRSATKAEER